MSLSLAQSSRKKQVSQDPRNTAWSNNFENFGHRQLLAMGWKPGRGLGSTIEGIAENIKIRPKIEGRGLGQPARPEIPTGLDDFQRLLGKLNGTSAEVEKTIQDKKKLGLYANFVLGEVIGEIDDKLVEIETPAELTNDSSIKKEKTRKDKTKKDKTKKEKSKKDEDKKHKKSVLKKTKEEKNADSKKRDKKIKKLEKKKQKAEDAALKVVKKHKKETSKKSKTAPENTKTELPARVPGAPRGIRATRSRYINMKRNATLDEKGLKEILMI